MAKLFPRFPTSHSSIFKFRNWMLCLPQVLRRMAFLMEAGTIRRLGKYVCVVFLMTFVLFLLMTTVRTNSLTNFSVLSSAFPYSFQDEGAANGTKVETHTVKTSLINATASRKRSNKNTSSAMFENFTKSRETTASIKIKLMRNISRQFTNEEFTLHILKNDVISCLKSFQEGLTELPLSSNDAYMSFRKDLFMLNILSYFNDLLMSLSIKAVIIEPSVIYCMLLPTYKKRLEKKKFNISTFHGTRKVFTFGIQNQNIRKLQEEHSIYKFREAGFQPYFVQKPIVNWMKTNEKRSINNTLNFPETYTPHVFYSWHDLTIHIVVFYNRNEYMWHDALGKEDNLNIPHREHLLFVNHPSAYEKFTLVSMANKSEILANFYVPSSPHYFLIQMQNSRFLECNSTRAKNVSYTTDLPNSHSSLSVDKFNRQFLVSLREMKTVFHPLLMNFWIFSGTMLGWYRECNVIPYTTDVDFAAWASDVEDLDYIKTRLLENKNLILKERMGVPEKALEYRLDSSGLRVDLFFLYQIKNGSWASGHRPSRGYFFKYFYPHFTLCSAELMGEKVQVPCETEKVILAEYGPNWMKPVTSWNYEASIYNRGPNIYWNNKTLKGAYHDY